MPIVAAGAQALQEDGRNPFSEFQVPQAVLALKQGFGRLIRTKTDRGVLALLDSRIQRMAYGKIFLESLPRYGTTHELADVARFLEKRGNPERLGARSASPACEFTNCEDSRRAGSEFLEIYVSSQRGRDVFSGSCPRSASLQDPSVARGTR